LVTRSSRPPASTVVLSLVVMAKFYVNERPPVSPALAT
jgi:hypothetical protein